MNTIDRFPCGHDLGYGRGIAPEYPVMLGFIDDVDNSPIPVLHHRPRKERLEDALAEYKKRVAGV